MAPGLILETSFLIDLERELLRGEAGPAQAFLERRRQEPLFVTFTVAGELAAGATAAERDAWQRALAPFGFLGCTREVCWSYGHAYRYLRDNGLLIGANDLWIAATALAHELPLVTRDLAHFRRVPDLVVLGYGPAADGQES